MYKDKDRQREADKERQRRYRESHPISGKRRDKGVTESGRDKGVTDKLVDAMITGDVALADKCADEILGKPERTAQGNIRVSKPGDDDYVPQCETTRAFIDGRDKRPETGKRGKDIKCFADLPPDVQETIHKLSTIDGKIDQTAKANRTAIAIHYQRLFPDRYNSTGVA